MRFARFAGKQNTGGANNGQTENERQLSRWPFI
jgi:hypothetical protein